MGKVLAVRQVQLSKSVLIGHRRKSGRHCRPVTQQAQELLDPLFERLFLAAVDPVFFPISEDRAEYGR